MVLREREIHPGDKGVASSRKTGETRRETQVSPACLVVTIVAGAHKVLATASSALFTLFSKGLLHGLLKKLFKNLNMKRLFFIKEWQ